MTRRLLVLWMLAAVVVAGAMGCTNSSTKDDRSLTEGQRRVPEFFDKIPANSPYVLTSIEAFPSDVIDQYLGAASRLTKGFRADLGRSAGPSGRADHSAAAVLDELAQIDSLEDYKKLGLSAHPKMAVYGIGWYPVVRMTLGDADTFRATLSRMETKAGVDARMRTRGEATYREYGPPGSPWRAVLSITDHEAVLGVAPQAGLPDFVGYMLGQKPIGRTLADVDVIERIQSKYQLSPFLVGYVDVVGIAATAMGAAPRDPIRADMAKVGAYEVPDMTDICRREVMSLFEKVPRLVFGYSELTARHIEVTGVVETSGDFSANLAATAVPIPGWADQWDPRTVFGVGVGADVQQVLNLVGKIAEKIRQKPYKCSDLDLVNRAANRGAMTLQLVPPVLSSIAGAMAKVTGLDVSAQSRQVEHIDALALVGSDDPMALFAQLRQMIAPLKNMSLKTNGVPVAVDAKATPSWLARPHMAMTKRLLGGSTGVGMQDDMAVLLERSPAGPDSHQPLLTVAYDYGRLDLPGFRPPNHAGRGAAGGLAGLAKEMFGMQVVEFDASNHGLILRYRAETFPETNNSP